MSKASRSSRRRARPSTARSSATPASRLISSRRSCKSRRGRDRRITGRRPGARRLARRRRLVVLAAQHHRRGADSRAGAAGLGDEVGGHQRPGHHRYADGVSRGANRQRDADRADEEDHVADRADHGLTRQPGARRDRRRVSRRREAVDLSVAIHQGGAARPGRQVSRDRASRPGAATWWLRCRASKTARPAIPSFSRRSRSWRQESNSARANRRRSTLNCQAEVTERAAMQHAELQDSSNDESFSGRRQPHSTARSEICV